MLMAKILFTHPNFIVFNVQFLNLNEIFASPSFTSLLLTSFDRLTDLINCVWFTILFQEFCANRMSSNLNIHLAHNFAGLLANDMAKIKVLFGSVEAQACIHCGSSQTTTFNFLKINIENSSVKVSERASEQERLPSIVWKFDKTIFETPQVIQIKLIERESVFVLVKNNLSFAHVRHIKSWLFALPLALSLSL